MKPKHWLLVIIGVLTYLMFFGGEVANIIVPNYVARMAEAIKKFEGWYPGSRSYRNNNPGNLKYAGQFGATGQDEQGHAIFSTYTLGWNALLAQLRSAFNNTSRVYNSSMTLYEFFARYAEGNQIPYAQSVARALGVSPETTLEGIKS